MSWNIVVINEVPDLVPAATFLKWVAACQTQIAEHLAPAWAGQPNFDGDVALGMADPGTPIPANSAAAVLLRDSDQADALGYHQETSAGEPLAKIFVGSDMQDGANPSVTLSHELCEMVVNPILERSFKLTVNGEDRFYMGESADACEDDIYGYPIDGVTVSDFVFPAFFDLGAAAGAKLDYGGHVARPLQILSGGYLAYYAFGKGWTQDFSEHYRNMGSKYVAKSRFRLAQVPRHLRQPSTRI